jgi:hypothetical protein
MKFLILILFNLIITSAIEAQLNNRDSLKLYKNDFHPQNKKIIPKYYSTLITRLNYDNSVLKIPRPLLTYRGNTNFFNIYQSTPDNMFVIKPDSTIVFNMPIKKLITGIEPPN